MKFSQSFLPVLFCTLAAAEGLSVFGFNQKPLGDTHPSVPGDNPLTYCKPDHDDDILRIDHVNIDPNPPLKGNNITVEAVGEFLEDVGEGAYVILQVKYGLIRLVNMETDLCDQFSNIDLNCPIKKGEAKITKQVALPNEIPPGLYTVLADAYTARPESKKLTCLEATITFT